jgi:hypothetical protein
MAFFGIEDFCAEYPNQYNMCYNDLDKEIMPVNKWAMCINNGTLLRIYTDIIETYGNGFEIVPSYHDFLDFAAKCHDKPDDIKSVFNVSQSLINYVDHDTDFIFDLYNYIIYTRDSTGHDEGYLFTKLSYKQFNNFVDKFHKTQRTNDYDVSDEDHYLDEAYPGWHYNNDE